MNKQSSKTAQYCLETIGIRQLSTEVLLGLRHPVTIRAGEVHGGMPRRQLSKLYAAMQAYNTAVTAGKE